MIIGIGGPSGSGKSTFSNFIKSFYGNERISFISLDHYYYSVFIDPVLVNFDHPDAIDLGLLQEHLSLLSVGETVSVPCYNILDHKRTDIGNKVEAKDIIIIEGIFALLDPIRGQLDLAIYMDVEQDICLERRIIRDTVELCITEKAILEQYYRDIKPMFEEFILPTKNNADLIIDGNSTIENNLLLLNNHILENFDFSL